MDWTSWEPLETAHSFNNVTLRETLDGGQAFRWQWIEKEHCWEGVFGKTVVRLRLVKESKLELCTPFTLNNSALNKISEYLGAGIDWKAILDELPWRSDPILKESMEAFVGLRILNQPFGETLLAFLCSATKQIPQIKVMCENMAQAFGESITENHKSLPGWKRLSKATENELRQLGLGFRAKNIKKTADIIASRPDLLDTIELLPYSAAKEELMKLPGVGEKIADCALLFGAGKLEAFPVDTWILKILRNRYGLGDWNAKQIAQFGRIHFGQYAGLAQQYLFSWERSQ